LGRDENWQIEPVQEFAELAKGYLAKV
jgi:hypothetical protein